MRELSLIGRFCGWGGSFVKATPTNRQLNRDDIGGVQDGAAAVALGGAVTSFADPPAAPLGASAAGGAVIVNQVANGFEINNECYGPGRAGSRCIPAIQSAALDGTLFGTGIVILKVTGSGVRIVRVAGRVANTALDIAGSVAELLQD